jgi:hypothetical protein
MDVGGRRVAFADLLRFCAMLVAIRLALSIGYNPRTGHHAREYSLGPFQEDRDVFVHRHGVAKSAKSLPKAKHLFELVSCDSICVFFYCGWLEPKGVEGCKFAMTL